MSAAPEADRWQFWIDRGGTFTDCIGISPQGQVFTEKLLSDDGAEAAGIRRILGRAEGPAGDGVLPACSVKLGSTVATNALLERRGAATLLVASPGLGDVVAIGTQERPNLFDLAIVRPSPLHQRAIEVSGRVGADGGRRAHLDLEAARAQLARARAEGMSSVAIALVHAYAFPGDELALAALARELGFEYVATSHHVACELGLLARAETTSADAYLTPLLRRHSEQLADALPGSRLRFIQSSGGLTDAASFRGPSALLSGPAGGVIAARRVARDAGFERAIAFDMGGTSTDVSLVRSDQLDRSFETIVGGLRVRAPMLRVHTVAAGGGSLCRFDGFRLTVGPQSAGADPGPLCYARRDASGALGGGELALTDLNFFLGRVQADRFPFALERQPVDLALQGLRRQLTSAGFDRSADDVASGLIEIANANMAQAIAQVSIARGVDPRQCALVGFGGAAGQHVCAIARVLGIRTVLLHPLAGLLSAYGIGIAPASWDGARDAGRLRLPQGSDPLPDSTRAIFSALEEEGRSALADEGVAASSLQISRGLDLRYVGTDTPLAVGEAADWQAAFASEHQRRFGYARPGRAVEIMTVRVRVAAADSGTDPWSASAGLSAERELSVPQARRCEPVWFAGAGRVSTPIFDREALTPGALVEGPAVILEGEGTVVVDLGFCARLCSGGLLRLEDLEASESHELRRSHPSRAKARDDVREVADPVRLEVVGNRFMSIAEQMGAVLRNTAVSTNIKERLDYSCAVFDAEGGLVANAPHIPVHLGAMSETVRVVRAAFPRIGPGDVVATNDPFQGGSHLPDVTVVTPVFLDAAGDSQAGEAPAFFVASRGHHADIGGVTPGSMPADSRTLEEEGVVLHPFLLVKGGVLDEVGLRQRLAAAAHPARSPDDNLADLEAAIAANRQGVRLLRSFAAESGQALLRVTMAQLQRAAAAMVAHQISKLSDGAHRFRDSLDDGTPVAVCLEVAGDRMTIDFAGTGRAVPGNANAPRAVVQAAVIYVLRSLVEEAIPLNGGCLAPVEIQIPAGSILDPPAGSAVAGGNVETSQRVVDVLLGALGIAAASQGTMNNLSFGDEHFGYYETIGGGAGAGPDFDGASGVHTHMTNTRITDVEVLENRAPVLIERFALRAGSGGRGRHCGGDGLIRRYRFEAPVTATLLTERRSTQPFGVAGGGPGAAGRNILLRADGSEEELPGKCSVTVAAGEGLLLETPGGGGFGAPTSDRDGA